MGEITLILTAVAKKVGISPALLIAVCTTETNLRNIDTPQDGATTSYGVCQVKLETARFMGKVYRKPEVVDFSENDIREIEKNAKIAALYLSYQLKRYDGNTCKAVAAYNAGRFKESKLLPGMPFNATYIEKVQKNLKKIGSEKILCKKREGP